MDQIIPLDIVFGIFTRLPLKTLMRFKCMSNALCNMINNNPCLGHMHLKHGALESKILLNLIPRAGNLFHISLPDNNNNNKEMVDIHIPYGYELDCFCHGLLCLFNFLNGSVILFNPSMQETLPLPPTSASTLCRPRYGLGFDGKTNTHKVVRISAKGIAGRLDFFTEIHTVGTKSWRLLNKTYNAASFSGKPVFLQGALHWLSDHKEVRGKFVRFDLEEEEFDCISLPFSFNCLIQLVELEGVLAIAKVDFQCCVEIWMLKDYSKNKWVLQYATNTWGHGQDLNVGCFYILGNGREGEILLHNFINPKIMVYNPKTDRLIDIPNLKAYSCFASLLSYRKRGFTISVSGIV